MDQHQAAITNESIQLIDYIPDDDESNSLFDHQQQTEAFVMGSIAKAPNRACKSPKQMDRNGVCRDVWNLKGPNNKSTLVCCAYHIGNEMELVYKLCLSFQAQRQSNVEFCMHQSSINQSHKYFSY